MGYHHIVTSELEQFDDRPADVRSITAAAGLDGDEEPFGIRIYEAGPGQQLPRSYHSHDEQTEAFYVLDGVLHIETPSETFVLAANEAFVVEPGNPHRAYNPPSATSSVRVLAIGAPSVHDAKAYEE